MSQGEIHDEHPFATPQELRDPVRRFRGRLTAPVTIVTSGGPSARTGLTVSSVIVAEGEPAFVHFLAGTGAEVWDSIADTGTFIVHVLERGHRSMSDVFAGYRPSPGGLFAGLDITDTPHGPEIQELPTRCYCRLADSRETAFHTLVTGVIERVQLHDLRDPLRWFRGEYFMG